MSTELSIIIITKNEEHYLPLLLESIGKIPNTQEIIVCDADSSDKTTKIAKSFGCKVVSGGLPAKGRNIGQTHAKGSYLLFLDADSILSENFIELLLSDFKNKKLDIASGYLLPLKGNAYHRLAARVVNTIYFLFQKNLIGGYGTYIIITKEQFDKLGGFDESLSVYEDVEFLKRHGKQSNFGFLKKPHIYNSVRRFEQDGTFKTTMKYTLWPIYYKFLGGKKIESILGGYKMDREK